MSDRKYTRERLFLLLDSDSEERAAFLRRFTEDEQKALIYRFHKGPGLGRVDLNLTPPPHLRLSIERIESELQVVAHPARPTLPPRLRHLRLRRVRVGAVARDREQS